MFACVMATALTNVREAVIEQDFSHEFLGLEDGPNLLAAANTAANTVPITLVKASTLG
jgi:hypothetical protein